MILWVSICISLDFYGYPCIDLLWILDPGNRESPTDREPYPGHRLHLVKKKARFSSLTIFLSILFYNLFGE